MVEGLSVLHESVIAAPRIPNGHPRNHIYWEFVYYRPPVSTCSDRHRQRLIRRRINVATHVVTGGSSEYVTPEIFESLRGEHRMTLFPIASEVRIAMTNGN